MKNIFTDMSMVMLIISFCSFSLTYMKANIDKDMVLLKLHEDGTKTTIITEKIVPLIEDDEDLDDFECFLRKI